MLHSEPLESRSLLAGHSGFAYDASDELLAVDPNVQAKLGDLLALISADYESLPSPSAGYSIPEFVPGRDSLIWEDSVGVAVVGVAKPGEGDALRAAFQLLGSTRIVAVDEYVSGTVPFAALDDLAAVPSLRYADAAVESVPNAGIINQASLALEADVARARFGVDGTGVRVGVISDSFNNRGGYAFDVATGALPAGVTVLKEHQITVENGVPQRGTDEGRAMAQLVHAIAPGAQLFFATDGQGPVDFADSIKRLAAAGCQIIVDDITEAGVPWFQDGVVAQAVNAAVRDAGVTYLTSAGNFARNSYAADFQSVAASSIDDLPTELSEIAGLGLHDFDPGPAVDVFQRVQIPAGTDKIRLTMQWNQPWGANAADVDLFVYAADGQTLLTRIDGSHQTGGDPVLGGSMSVPAGLDEVQLVIGHAGGVSPGYLKYLTYHTTLEAEYATGSSTIVAHANSATAAAVGASFYFRTPAYRQTPAGLAPSSSWGGTPILRDDAGSPLASPIQRQQPRFVTPNFGDTSFFGQDVDFNGLPNFSGTSAAAPNAAAVAALMMQLDPTLTSPEIFAILGATASDMEGAGGPLATGAGLINAERALTHLAGVTVIGTVFEDFDRSGSQAASELPVADATVFLDLNGNGTFDRAPAADAAFSFVGFEASVPTAIGIRELIDNPNEPNTGPLKRPFTVASPIDVDGLPGGVTDVGVLFTLRSDQVLPQQVVAPLFVTLISPDGVRVPLKGTTIVGDGSDANPFTVHPLELPADGQAYPQLVSQFETPVSEFLNGAGQAVLSQADLAAVVGTDPNGRWQLEVQSAEDNPARTATLESWELFLQTAEPAVQTDAEGRYAFPSLAPAAVAGGVTPRLLVPAGRSLLSPAAGERFAVGSGQQLVDVNFAVSLPTLITRPPLRRSATIRVDQAVIGPQPIQFSWADLSTAALTVPTSERFIVAETMAGRVEKWNGRHWIDVTRPPATSSPQQLLSLLAVRIIQPGDHLRWIPPVETAGEQAAFKMISWDGVTIGSGLAEVDFAATPA